MKNGLLTLCFLITLTVTAQHSGPSAKRVTVLLSNISLEKALTILSLSYDVQFSYSDDVVPTEALVNLAVQDQTLVAALKQLLEPYHITYKIVSDKRIVLRKNPVTLTQTIRGIVVDDVTGAPIPGATVIVDGTEPVMGTTTDQNGLFKLESVMIGRQSVIVRSIGHDTKPLNGLLLGTGKEVFLNVRLSESVTSMDEVVIVALRNDGIPGDGAAVTSGRTFSVEESRRYAGSMGDPARMASAFAGVTPASDENNALVVRGNSPRGVLWRIEGIEIPNPNHFASEGASSGIVSVLSPNVVERSDFLTGAFPAQYGNALSAVMDIHLRKGNNQRKEYSIQTGLLGLEASAEGPFHKTHQASYLVNYRYSTLSIIDKLGVDLNQAGQYKDYQDLSFNLNFPTKAGMFSVFGIGGKSQSNRTDTTFLDNNATDMGVLGVVYRHQLNSNTFINGSVSLSGTHISKYSEINGLEGGPLALQEDYTKSYARASFSMRKKITSRYFAEAGVTVSRLNYDFFLRNIDPGNPGYQVITNFSEHDHDYTSIAQAFVYARQYFSSNLFAFYGFHFMRFALTGDYSLEPRAGLRWLMTPERSLSMAYGKHSRIENLQYYLGRNHLPGGNEVQINRNLRFTRAHHVVLSYDQAFSTGQRLKLESYYQQLYDAPVQADPTSVYASINEDTGFVTDSLINNGDGKNYGVEASFERSFSNDVYYMINGSLFQSTFSVHGHPEKNTSYNANYSLHLVAGKEFSVSDDRKRFGMNLKLSLAGGKRYIPIDLQKSIEEKKQVYQWDTAFDKQLPDYFRTDFQFVYRVNRNRYAVEWRLDVQNLTHHRNASYYYYDVPSETIRLKRQVGLVPLLSCRFEF